MKKRRALLYTYSTFVFIFGLCYIPLKSVYEGKLYKVVYAPIWKVNARIMVNDSTLYYEIDIHRILITLLVFTLITTALYIVFNDVNN
jgi:hypothetical protein